MAIRNYVPNSLTLLNLLCGLLALVNVFNGNFYNAFYFVILGIFFDFWDGFAARKLNVSSPLGLQLDSLADMVTSGVVPGLMMFKLLQNIQNGEIFYVVKQETFYIDLIKYLGFIITLASAYRLAKFNIDERQTENFIGLPTPANALLVMSIGVLISDDEKIFLNNPYVLLAITIVSAYLLNAEIPLFSLKVKDFSWKNNKVQFLFVFFSVVLIVNLSVLAIPIIILSYILLSLVLNFVKK